MTSFVSATAEAVAAPKPTEASVVLRSKKTGGSKSAYSDFLGKLANTGISSTVEDDVEADDDDPAAVEARAERKREATRQHALSARRSWVERMEEDIDEDGFSSATASASIASAAKPAQAPDSSSFEPAATFNGPRRGFVFKAGAQGIGYYADAASAVDVSEVGASLFASASPPRKLAPAMTAAAEAAAWEALDVSDPAAASPSRPATLPPAVSSSPDSLEQLTLDVSDLSTASPPQPIAPKPPSPKAPTPKAPSPKAPEPELLAKARQATEASTGESAAQLAAQRALDAQRAAELKAAEATVEFGSMKLAEESSSSEEEEDKEEEEEEEEPDVTPAERIKQLMALRSGGGDDSDGEIEFG